MLASGIQISVKDTSLISCEFQAPLPFFTRYPKDLSDLGISLLKKNYDIKNKVRAIGIRAINLVPDNQAIQCCLLYDQNKIDEHEALEEKVNILRNKYGRHSIQRASLLNNRKVAQEKKYDGTSLPGNFFNK